MGEKERELEKAFSWKVLQLFLNEIMQFCSFFSLTKDPFDLPLDIYLWMSKVPIVLSLFSFHNSQNFLKYIKIHQD